MTHRHVKEAKVLWSNDSKKERYRVEAYLLGRNIRPVGSEDDVGRIKRRTQLHQSLIPYIPPKYCGSRTLHMPGKSLPLSHIPSPFCSLNKYIELFFEGLV